MSATTQPTSFIDLFTDLLNRVRADTGVTATSNQAKRYINTALQDMHIGMAERVPWAERRAVLRTQQDYTTGTVAATQGSTTLTGTSTLWNTANNFSVNNVRAGGKIKIGREVYEVSSIASDTSLTLATALVGTTASGLGYTYFEDEYALASDFLRPVDARYFDANRSIEIIGRADFRRFYPRNDVPGSPRIATLITLAPSGDVNERRRIILHPPPDEFRQIPYTYITTNLVVSSAGAGQTGFSADTDEPIVPLRYRHLIVLHALKNWYRDKENDPRGQEVSNEYIAAMLRMGADTEIGSPQASIVPRRGSYRRAAKRPWSGSGRGYDVNGEFDRLEK